MNNIKEQLTSKVEISVACRHLKDLDVFSKSDPMCVLFQKMGNSYFEVDRTEIIKNNLNPVFLKVFEIDYHFEERQLFKVEVYDIDSSSTKLTDHDFLGKYEFSLGELASRMKIEASLNYGNNKSKRQTVILTCHELPNNKESIILKFHGNKLDKKDLFGKSDPILELYRSNDPIKFADDDSNLQNYNNFTLIYQSDPIKNTLDPSWPEFSMKLNRLCLEDKDRLLKIVSTDWNFTGKLDFIGHFFTSVNHLIKNCGVSGAFELINLKKKAKKKNYKNSGMITVSKALIQYDHSFFDYISGGTELNFTVAIDFTASNGRQNDPKSLHFIPPNANLGFSNQYESAIISVGSIIQDYDSDKMFPALGFGAQIPPRNDVSHCFPINFCIENPFCFGVDGLLQAYRSAIRTVTLYGPTNFSPAIRHVQQFAQTYRDGSKYFVLLIITDGIITDLDMTIDAIIDCSFLPMSIIIIGVGDEDFSAMDALDCDKGRLKHGHKVADRDIVQFVAIRDFVDHSSRSINQDVLSKAVLFELPQQVTDWMKNHRIAPLSPNTSIGPYPMSGDLSHPPPYPSAKIDPSLSVPPYPMQ